jgi:hypothetical protein
MGNEQSGAGGQNPAGDQLQKKQQQQQDKKVRFNS